jgi:hypothetical protein
MTDPKADVRNVGDLVRHLERAAIGRLTAAAGNESLCTISRNGAPRPAAKYHEGAVAALAEARRAVDKQAPDRDPALTVRAVRHRWATHVGTDTAAWRAYNDGGLDALATLLSPTPAQSAISSPSARDAATSRSARDALEHVGASQPGPARPPASRAPTSEAPNHGPAPSTLRGGARWPRRRTAATAVLAPVLFVALVTTGGGLMLTVAPLWTALVALTALVSAATLATYLPLPDQGWRPDLGCSPCAAMSAGSVLAAAWLLGSAPLQPAMAAVALAAATFGLVQRLTGTGTGTTCST